jgi:hypothetical protein
VEDDSLLKKLLDARLDPGSARQMRRFWGFRSRFVVAIGSMPTFSTG